MKLAFWGFIAGSVATGISVSLHDYGWAATFALLTMGALVEYASDRFRMAIGGDV